jgi:carbonic anhydrase
MKKTISFQSPAEHYTATSCIVWCFDDRFTGLLEAFSRGLKNFDLVKVAGGAKVLAGDPSSDRDFVLSQIKTSIRLHGTKRVVLMLHRDCGAYGGSKSFVDAEAEKNYYVAQLAAAKQFVASEIPDIQVEICFADFDGLYTIG